MASLYIVYDNLSPLDESECRRGISHVIEHMIGKAVDALLPQIHEYGISSDFCTNFEFVKASFTGTADAMEKMVPAIMRQIVFFDAERFTEDDFENERRAVINEVLQHSSDAFHEILHRCQREAFGIYGPEGTLDNVRAYTFEKFKEDYNRLVPHPSRIVYVGPRKIQFPKIAFSDRVQFKPITPRISNDYVPRIPESSDKNECNIIVFTGMEPVVGDRDYAAMTLAAHMLAGNDESVLYDRLRMKDGLVYGCYGEMLTLRCAGILFFYTTATSQNTGKVISGMAEVLEDPERFLTEELFAHTKKYYENSLKATQILRFCNSQDLVRHGMITEMHDILDIGYPELVATVKKYLARGKVRTYVS